jgi:hypothetical protein
MLISANLKYRKKIPILFENEEIYVPLKYFVKSVYIYQPSNRRPPLL